MQVCMYCVHHKKEPKKPPEHTSEHVKSQHFLGACPKTHLAQSILQPPTFCLCPGPGPDYNNHTVTEFQNNARRSCSLSTSVQTCPSFNHMEVNIWLGRKGTGKCIGSIANMGLGFEYLFTFPSLSIDYFHTNITVEYSFVC